METEKYLTLKKTMESKTKEKGSEFICLSFPIQSLDEAHSILEDLKKKYYDATHICYALSLVDGTIRYSDAGEPNGTAGVRISNAIQHFELSNILVAVVRYFGGTKLGIGPLGKAYYDSAASNLSSAEKVEMRKYFLVKVSIGFELSGSLYHLLNIYEAKIAKTHYGDKITLEIIILPEKYKPFYDEFINSSNGKAQIDKLEDFFA